MVTEAEGSMRHVRSKTQGIPYDKFSIHLPVELARDGTFPFQMGDRLRICIVGEELVISKPGMLSTLRQIQAKIAEKKNGFDDLIIVEHDEISRQIAIACADLLNDVLKLLKNPAEFEWSQ